MMYSFSPLAVTVFAILVSFVLGLSFYLGSKAKSAKGYYAAHGTIPWFINGIAFAGDYLSAASFLGICGLIAFYGYDGFLYSIGFLAGWVVALFVIAEPIKRLGKFTFADALDSQFDSRWIKLAAAISTLVVSVFYLIPQMVGAGALIKPLLGLPFAVGVIGVGVIVILIVVTAGMVSTTWVQFIKGSMLVIFCGIVTLMLLSRGFVPKDPGTFPRILSNKEFEEKIAPLGEVIPATDAWIKKDYSYHRLKMKDGSISTWTARAKRRSERFEYRVKGCVVTFHSTGKESPTAYLVPTRDISAGGMSLLHGTFIYPGIHCTLQLITKSGTWKNLEAKVVRCVHVSGAIHEVGVQFDTGIDPAEYCSNAVKTRVLLVEDDPSIVRLAKLFLTQLKADVDHAPNGQKAVELASASTYDVILMEVDLPEMDGIATTTKLREQGYSGTIIAITAMTEPGDEEKCLAAGFDRYYPKPYDRELLASIVDSLNQKPMVSSLAEDLSMTEIIRDFVEELPPKLQKIDTTLQANDLPALQKLCRTLKGEAGGYGFEPISAAAAKVEKAVIEKMEAGEIKKLAEQLVKLGHLARCAPRRESPPEDPTAEAPAEGATDAPAEAAAAASKDAPKDGTKEPSKAPSKEPAATS